MLQLLYISSAAPNVSIDLIGLLHQAQARNLKDGITGLLFTDGRRFLQALEGPVSAVDSTFARIQADGRHRALVQLSRREISAREFGEWSMASRKLDDMDDAFLHHVAALCRNASPNIQGTFEGLIKARRTG